MNKKLLSIIGAMSLSAMCGITAFAGGIDDCGANQVKLRIDDPMINSCGIVKELDAGRGTVPVIQDGRTLVPIRAVMESFGSSVYWDGETRQVYISTNNSYIRLTIDSDTALINTREDTDKPVKLDVAPQIINGRTMVPLRFVAESAGLDVDWNGDERVITITEPKGATVKFANVEGEFAPIKDLFKIRMGAKDTAVYTHNGEQHTITTDITSIETFMDAETEFDPNKSYSSITVDGKKYEISNVFNFSYIGVADLSPNADGFEIVLMDKGVSDDNTATVFTYNQHGLVCTKTYSGLPYPYYENGTGTVYCDGNGHIINEYLGFTDTMYAYSLNTIMGGDGIVSLDGEYIDLKADSEIIGKEFKFARDYVADYRLVDAFPTTHDDLWNIGEYNCVAMPKDSTFVINDIIYMENEDFGTRHVQGFCATIDGQKYVMLLQYAG